jgi:aminocarboxymuconate-semialdehyde decarboxylase
VTVIDCQAHWYPRVLLDSYLELEQYPRWRTHGDGYLWETAPDRWFPIRPEFHELDLQLETFAAAGVDVIISSSGSFGDVDRLEVGRAREVAIAVNEARADAEREHPGRFYGVATIPWQDTEAGTKVLDDAVRRLGLRGVLLHSNIDGAPVDSEHCRPIYARIAELGVPVFLHPARTIAEEQLRDYGLEILLGFMLDASVAALRLVLGGIIEQNPELKVVHPHCGATLPYLAGRIDGSYLKPYSLGEPLSSPPSEQLAGFYTDTMCQDKATLDFARAFYRDGHMLFAADYPYFQPEDALAFVNGAVPEGEREAILAGNARGLLGIEV